MDNFCSNLFLFIKEIRDGDNSNSSLIGTYCGDPTRTPGQRTLGPKILWNRKTTFKQSDVYLMLF